MPGERDAVIDRIVAEAAADALSARAIVESILRRPAERTEFIAVATPVTNSRFRQVVARAIQRVGAKDDVRSMLRGWQQNETDEFALAAINDALAPGATRRHPKMLKDLTDVGRTFRFVADRLRHKVLNAVPRAGLSFSRLSSAIDRIDDPEMRGTLEELLADLKESVARLESAVSIDADAEAFESRDIELVPWLQQFARRYSAQWKSVSARVTAADQQVRLTITAPTYLLDLVFTNLFDNARQATGESTRIDIVVRDAGRDAVVRIDDNGPGFTEPASAAAFAVPITSGTGRQGRGLMEVNDAVRRLGGVPTIVKDDGRRCVRLTLPRAGDGDHQ